MLALVQCSYLKSIKSLGLYEVFQNIVLQALQEFLLTSHHKNHLLLQKNGIGCGEIHFVWSINHKKSSQGWVSLWSEEKKFFVRFQLPPPLPRITKNNTFL